MIPRRIHLVWIGSDPLPDRCRPFVDAWRALHPAWTLRLWGNEAFRVFRGDGVLARMRADPGADAAMICDRLRFLILARYGGLYVDVDVEPLRPFDAFLGTPTAIVVGELDERDRRRDRVCDPSVILARPRVPLIRSMLRDCYRGDTWPRGGVLGNYLVTHAAPGQIDLRPSHEFMGYARTSATYCLHWPHRLGSWRAGSTFRCVDGCRIGRFRE